MTIINTRHHAVDVFENAAEEMLSDLSRPTYSNHWLTTKKEAQSACEIQIRMLELLSEDRKTCLWFGLTHIDLILYLKASLLFSKIKFYKTGSFRIGSSGI